VPPESLGSEHIEKNGPYVLFCPCCAWSSNEIGILFDKPQGIHAQLSKIQNGGAPILTAKERRKGREEGKKDLISSLGKHESQEELSEGLGVNERLDIEAHFSNLKAFYQSQLADSSPVTALGFSADYGYGSPGALSRIMGLYTGGTMADKKSKGKSGTMREAQNSSEGLQISHQADEDIFKTLRSQGWEGTTSSSQRKDSPNQNTHLVSDLRPIAYLLRTKRSKRCRTCRHILSKPESKVQTTRFRIRLVALNYIPSIHIKPLQPTASPSSLLLPMKPTQFLLTFKNPLFDSVKVSLGTPVQTPGRFASKVTVLCPQFETQMLGRRL